MSWRDRLPTPRRLARGVLTVYIGTGLCLAVLQDALLFPGLLTTRTPRAAPAAIEAVDLGGVAGWRTETGADRVVVIAHGNGERASDLVGYTTRLTSSGWDAVLVEYRGYDGQPGWPTEAGLAEDFGAVLDALHDEGVPLSRMIVLGRSIGGGVSIAGIGERPIAGLVLESTFDSVVNVARSRFPMGLFPVGLLLRNDFDSHARLAGTTLPIFQVHDTTDRVIPIERGRRLNAAVPGAVWMETEGYPHGYPLLWRPEVESAWMAWMEARVPGG